MNAFELLKTEHATANHIMEKLAATSSGARKVREELFAKLRQELEIHAQIEEDHLYPVLKKQDETKALVKDALHEHSSVKERLKELSGMDKTEPEWDEKLQQLKSDIDHHVHDEENELFPKATQLLSSDTVDELGRQLKQERADLIKRRKSH